MHRRFATIRKNVLSMAGTYGENAVAKVCAFVHFELECFTKNLAKTTKAQLIWTGSWEIERLQLPHVKSS